MNFAATNPSWARTTNDKHARVDATRGAAGKRRRPGVGEVGAKRVPSKTAEDLLDQYFRDVAPISVLDAETEGQRARGMEEAHLTAWQSLLASAPLLPTVLDFCRDRLDTDKWPAQTDEALRLSAALIKRPTAANQRRYEAHTRALAEHLRATDMDHALMTKTLELVEEVVDPSELPTGAEALVENLRSARRAVARAIQTRNDFISANLRLVIKIAKRYRTGNMPLVDLIQEGNLGLIEAVKRFDHRRGCRFSTYGAWWIRHAICRGIAERGRLVRIPLHVADAHRKVGRIRRELGSRLGQPPSIEEVADEAGLEVDKLHALDVDLTPLEVRLDHESGEGLRHSELIGDIDAVGPLDQVAHLDASDKALHLVEQLEPAEADILRRRFGLGGRDPQTLREIAREYRLSRERIRQLEHKGLARLRKRLNRVPIRASRAAAELT